MANPMSTMPMPQINLQGPNTQINNNNSNPSYTAFPGFYGNNSGNNLLNNQNNPISMNNTNPNKFNSIDRKAELVPNPINQNNQNINDNHFNNYPNNYFNVTPSSILNPELGLGSFLPNILLGSNPPPIPGIPIGGVIDLEELPFNISLIFCSL